MDAAPPSPSVQSSSDHQLLLASARGDRAAFTALVARHEEALYRFALRLCGSEAEAEDGLQEGLLAAWRHSGSYRGDAAVRTWLFQIVLNACRRQGRKKSGEPSEHSDLETAVSLESADARPDRAAELRQVGRALDLALSGLSDEAREVLLLRDVEGLSGEEVCAVLEVSLPAMKSRLHRARLELKEKVEALLGHPVMEVLR